MKTLKLTALLVVISLAAKAQVNLTQGLQMHLPFNGNTTDVSGNGNNATNNGATLVADRFGNPNSAYSFDGNNDYMEILNHNGLKPTTFPFAVTFWVKLNGNTNFNHVFWADYPTNGTWDYYGYFANFNTSNSLAGSTGNGGLVGPNARRTRTQTGFNALNQWFMATINYTSATTFDLYINCQLVAANYSGTATQMFYSTGRPTFGRGYGFNGGPVDYLNATLDDFRFYTRALNQAEISFLYLQNTPSFTIQASNSGLICPGGNGVTLSTNPANLNNISWSNGSSGNTTNVTCPGTYIATYNGPCGLEYDTVEVDFAPCAPEVNLGSDEIKCATASVAIGDSVDGAISYLWQPGGQTTPFINVTNAGTYTLTVTTLCGTSTDQINVINLPGITGVQIPADTVICIDDTLNLSVLAPVGTNILWQNGGTGSNFEVYEPGQYTVAFYNQCGSASFLIKVGLDTTDCTTDVPEWFNTDASFIKNYILGENEALTLNNLPLNNSIAIYDATGKIIFQTANYKNDWMPMSIANGIYYYRLLGDNKLKYNGRILLNK